jgi:hypothetical protein
VKPSSEKAETGTFTLSRRLKVEITVGAGGMVCEWDPAQPEKLTAKELRRYRAARQEMLQRLAKSAGGAVVCVEL